MLIITIEKSVILNTVKYFMSKYIGSTILTVQS